MIIVVLIGTIVYFLNQEFEFLPTLAVFNTQQNDGEIQPTTPSDTEEEPALKPHHMPWQFFAYNAPGFLAYRMGTFPPQDIYIISQQDGWAFVQIDDTEGWVYINANAFYTGEILGAFDEADGRILHWLHPQVVTIQEQHGNWLHIYTSEGYAWVNFYFQPPIHLLEDFMRRFGDSVAVFYENLASGFTFSHNGDTAFFGASATKAPFALYIYQKAERGETGMTDVFTYTSGDYWHGSGVIRQRYYVGTTFTQRRLLHLMLAPSDNIATRILRREHGLDGYRAFVESLGANPVHVHNLTYSHLTANDAGIFMRESYRYINSGGRYSHEFRDNLLANRYPFITSDYPIASKSGWSGTPWQAWHDMAIIYAPSPYVLVLLSSRAGNALDVRAYNEISMFIQAFNSAWFYPG